MRMAKGVRQVSGHEAVFHYLDNHTKKVINRHVLNNYTWDPGPFVHLR